MHKNKKNLNYPSLWLPPSTPCMQWLTPCGLYGQTTGGHPATTKPILWKWNEKPAMWWGWRVTWRQMKVGHKEGKTKSSAHSYGEDLSQSVLQHKTAALAGRRKRHWRVKVALSIIPKLNGIAANMYCWHYLHVLGCILFFPSRRWTLRGKNWGDFLYIVVSRQLRRRQLLLWGC